jgi:hypothetical protein
MLFQFWNGLVWYFSTGNTWFFGMVWADISLPETRGSVEWFGLIFLYRKHVVLWNGLVWYFSTGNTWFCGMVWCDISLPETRGSLERFGVIFLCQKHVDLWNDWVWYFSTGNTWFFRTVWCDISLPETRGSLSLFPHFPHMANFIPDIRLIFKKFFQSFVLSQKISCSYSI